MHANDRDDEQESKHTNHELIEEVPRRRDVEMKSRVVRYSRASERAPTETPPCWKAAPMDDGRDENTDTRETQETHKRQSNSSDQDTGKIASSEIDQWCARSASSRHTIVPPQSNTRPNKRTNNRLTTTRFTERRNVHISRSATHRLGLRVCLQIHEAEAL